MTKGVFGHEAAGRDSQANGSILQNVVGYICWVHCGEKGSWGDFAGPWECPPEIQRSGKTTGALGTCVLVCFVIVFSWDKMGNGWFPFICGWVRKDSDDEVDFLAHGQGNVGLGFTIPDGL